MLFQQSKFVKSKTQSKFIEKYNKYEIQVNQNDSKDIIAT